MQRQSTDWQTAVLAFFSVFFFIRVCLNYCRSYFCISNFILPFAVHFAAVNLVKTRSTIALFIYVTTAIFQSQTSKQIARFKAHSKAKATTFTLAADTT